MSRYIALDIETANLDMEAEGLEFGNPMENILCLSL